MATALAAPTPAMYPIPAAPVPRSQYRYAVVCASNQNRSMEAHRVLGEIGLQICSYGTGSAVRLPGPSIDKPNVYDFGTPYATILTDLVGKDRALYEANGLVAMLERNRRIKTAPERWQDASLQHQFDVILTCEERVFDAVCEELWSRPSSCNTPVHVVNLEIKDNPTEAAVGGRLFVDLARRIEACPDLDAGLDTLLRDFAMQFPTHPLLHCVSFH
ncbi:RNA polymerase II subunit A C-terminal domain phosphatase [Allomyces javanicus]|nr:RNA polymerase II subunit A C-terminal domain phosphatase [Allomyces javanicus]